MKRILVFLLFIISLTYAKTIPVIINEKEYKGERVKDYIFIPEISIVLYQDGIFELKKIDNMYISTDLDLLYDGRDIFKIYVSKDLILCPEKNLLFRENKKYETKNLGNIYFTILSYNYNFPGIALFAHGIYPRMRYILLELAIFNLDKAPTVLDQKMFTVKVGDRDYYPDPAISAYFANQGEEVLFNRLIQPREGITAYLVYDVPGLPGILKIDPYYGLKRTLEIRLP